MPTRLATRILVSLAGILSVGHSDALTLKVSRVETTAPTLKAGTKGLAPPTSPTPTHTGGAGGNPGGNVKTYSESDTLFEGIRYVSSRFLETLFGHEGAWVPDRQKFLIPDSSGKKWYFTLDNPFINVDEEVYNLGFPVRRGPEFLYLPLPSLIRILAIKGWRVETIAGLDTVNSQPAADLTQSAGGSGLLANRNAGTNSEPRNAAETGNLLDLTVEERDNGTLVTVKTAAKLESETFWVSPHFILKLQHAQVTAKFPLKHGGAGLVKNILTVQEKDLAQVTLYIPREIDTVECNYLPDAGAYQILVHKKNDRKTEAKESALKASIGDSSANSIVAMKSGPGTIIIDPGHGGKDQGAQVGGVYEAQVTLAVAKDLQADLKQLGYKALLTREDDRFVSLQDRPKFASSQGGDLYISLHCNSLSGSNQRKKFITGFTAYILREGESEEDKALARRENEAVSEESGKSNKSEISPVEWILLEHQLNLYSKESESFADKLVKSFDGFSIAKYGTGAGQAGFYVLVGAYMPAVLFEMGYLTHEEDRRILSSEKGQKTVAERLALAIDKYRHLSDEKKGPAGRPDRAEHKGKSPRTPSPSHAGTPPPTSTGRKPSGK